MGVLGTVVEDQNQVGFHFFRVHLGVLWWWWLGFIDFYLFIQILVIRVFEEVGEHIESYIGRVLGKGLAGSRAQIISFTFFAQKNYNSNVR